VSKFAELGSLDKVLTNLREQREKARVEVLLRAALQVWEGMVWLEKKKILHLALRNLLVFSFHAQDPDNTEIVRKETKKFGSQRNSNVNCQSVKMNKRIEDDEIKSGPESEDEVVSTQSTRNKKNTANKT
jgi:hypothetical protein